MVTNTIIDQAVKMSSNKPPSLAAWKYARPIIPLIAWFMGPKLGLSGANRTHVAAPCWTHEPCYLGHICMSGLVTYNVVLTVHANGYIEVGKWQVTWLALRDMVIIARHVEEFVLSFFKPHIPNTNWTRDCRWQHLFKVYFNVRYTSINAWQKKTDSLIKFVRYWNT